MPRYSYEEIILTRIHSLNSLLPHYWSELILLAEQLLSPEEKEELHKKLFQIEKMVFETEMISREKEDGTIVWFEKIKGRLSLYDIEMAMESNPDFYSFFEREDGTKITKFDVERELNRVKAWLFDKVKQRSSRIRFQGRF